MRVAFAGGMPRRLGGGGLEDAMSRTAVALGRRGVMADDVATGEDPFDLLHCFSTEPIVWHLLRNWSRNRGPLVVTPTIVLTRLSAAATLSLARVRPLLSTTASMRRDVLLQADAVLCLSQWELLFCRRLGVPSARVRVISNGSDAPREPPVPRAPDAPLLIVGGVSPRKRQAEVLEALGAEFPVVVAGAFAGDEAYRRRFTHAVQASAAQWLGHVASREELHGWQRQARAQVLLSSAEGQSLAVLDALAMGTHVVLSDIPVHRELHARFPDHTSLVRRISDLPAVVRRIPSARGELPAVPTWDDVAGAIVAVYESLA